MTVAVIDNFEMVFRTAREFIRERQALGRKKIESGYIFFGNSADERKINIFAKIFCSRKNERIIFFLQEKRGKSRLLKPMLLLLLSLLLLQLKKEEVAGVGMNLPTGRD